MSPSPSRIHQRLSPAAVRRILQSLSGVSPKQMSFALAVCDLMGEGNSAPVEEVLRLHEGEDPGGYLRTFKSRFNREAKGRLVFVSNANTSEGVYFTGEDPFAEEIADYSMTQTSRHVHAKSDKPVEAFAIEGDLPDSDPPRALSVYISFVEEDGSLAVGAADLLETHLRALLRDRFTLTIRRPDRVLPGKLREETRDRWVAESDCAIVLLSPGYLVEEKEAARVAKRHPRPILLKLTEIADGASVEPFTRDALQSGPAFEGAKDEKQRRIADTAAERTKWIIEERFGKDTTRRRIFNGDEIAAGLLKGNADVYERITPVPSRARDGRFTPETGRREPPGPAADGVPVLERLEEWATEEGSDTRLCALLGDLGMGKTTSCVLLTKTLLEKRHNGERIPLPIYFDLRDLSTSTLPDFGLRTILDLLLRNSSKRKIPVDTLLDIVESESTLVIFDGLDEVLVHLSPSDGQKLTRSLLSIASEDFSDSDVSPTKTKVLVSCRSHYFKTVRDEFDFFNQQNRERVRGEDYMVLTLLPFEEEQIFEYLERNIPGSDPERLMEMIRSVHDLRSLASQPLLLSMIREVLPSIEPDQPAGRPVSSADLYERFATRWLGRDEGKHTLTPEHKIELMTALALEVWRSQRRSWSATWMDRWLLRFLREHPDMELHYRERLPEQWTQDFRTATFLSRRGDSFRFAHSSLLEFFLANALVASLLPDTAEEATRTWDIRVPSTETFGFLGDLLARLDPPELFNATKELAEVARTGTPPARTCVFAYCLYAAEHNLPAPPLSRLDLSGTDLSGWRIGSEERPLILRGVSFENARMDDAVLSHVDLSGARLSEASLQRTRFIRSSLIEADVTGADLSGTVFRFCALKGTAFEAAQCHRTQCLFCTDAPHEPGMLHAPLEGAGEQSGSKVVIFQGHSDVISDIALSLDGSRILTGSDDSTARVWDATTGENTLTLTHDDWVRAVAWSPDATRILTVSADGTAWVWDATTGNQVSFSISVLPEGNVAVLSPDSTRVLGATGDAWRWLGRYAVVDGRRFRVPAEIDAPFPPLGV